MNDNNEEIKKILEDLENEGEKKTVKKSNKKEKILLIIFIIGIIAFIYIYNQVQAKKEEEKRNSIQKNIYEIVNEIVAKPIIYLYPSEEMEINVKLGKKEEIICSYPKYKDGWNVKAQPNGDLLDLDTNKELYALYYESNDTIGIKEEEEGFIVKGEDTAEFLEEKLEILGLTYKEKEEFIVYWLPKLESNKYNYIRFASKEEIEENMPLEISPKPDTTIRILMTYKGLDDEKEVKEQKLERVERKGYTAVEWGGTEIK